MDLPVDAHYYNAVARLDAFLQGSKARIARQREWVGQSKSFPGQTEDAQRTLDLMLDIVATIRDMRDGNVSIFRGPLN